MAGAVNSNKTWGDIMQCWLMAEVISGGDSVMRRTFWQSLPYVIPDLTAQLPIMTAIVRGEAKWKMCDVLSDCPLPTALSPEMAGWRSELVAAWEEQLREVKEDLNPKEDHLGWKYEYICALRGLAQVDRCAVPPGMTCSSVLPTLLGETHDVREEIKTYKTPLALYRQMECLSALAGWRPAPNVTTAPTILKAWGDFWLELYQKEGLDAGENEPDVQIIRKGIAAKAILNLMEAASEEETGVPTRMKAALLKSLIRATKVPGMENYYSIRWFDWQPQDATRFPADLLAELSETLLQKFRLFKQFGMGWWEERLHSVLNDALRLLVKWEQAEPLNLWPRIMEDVSCYLNRHMPVDDYLSAIIIHNVCKLIIRDEVANIESGRKLLQKVERYWISRCKHEISSVRGFAWEMRIQLHRAGLATETLSNFQTDLLQAVRNEKSVDVQMMLSTWMPDKDTPDDVRLAWERLWQAKLESCDEENSRIAAMVLLRPNPADDPVDPITRWQKLRQKLQKALPRLPKLLRQELSMMELTQMVKMMGELSLSGRDVNAG